MIRRINRVRPDRSHAVIVRQAKPIKGKALPAWGFFAFMEINWLKNLSSSIGYSMLTINNTDLQVPDAFHKGQYGLMNIRWYPVTAVLLGMENQYGRCDNFNNGYCSVGNKIQCSFEYNFSNSW
jgi:hypothetical protein